MNNRLIILIICMICLMICTANRVGLCGESDLDDDISGFKDDPITKYDDLGKLGKNVSFIKLNAKSRAMVRGNALIDSSQGDVVQGGVILKPGAKADDIIVIYEGDNNSVINDNR